MKALKFLISLLDTFIVYVMFFLMAYAIYYVFNVAPDEVVMGAVQRILYFHVGAASSTYLALGVLFVASVCHLADLILGKIDFPSMGRAAASVGFVCATIVLLTGMIWGYSSWNTWWRWEPRLVSVLVLWIFLLSYLYLSLAEFKSDQQRNTVSAVVGILSSIQVPIVIYSIKLLDRTEQLHPEVVGNMGLRDSRYTIALLLSTLSFLLLTVVLIRLRYRYLKLSIALTNLEEEKLYL
jgi:heme exporter protein C